MENANPGTVLGSPGISKQGKEGKAGRAPVKLLKEKKKARVGLFSWPPCSETENPVVEDTDIDLSLPIVQFWQEVDTYFHPPGAEELSDLRTLARETVMLPELKHIPPLGRTYADIWAEEGFVSKQSGYVLPDSMPGKCPGYLTQRLMAALVDTKPPSNSNLTVRVRFFLLSSFSSPLLLFATLFLIIHVSLYQCLQSLRFYFYRHYLPNK